jgi:deoxycytidylate deaminase
MTAGNEARRKASRGDLLALMAISEIYKARPVIESQGSQNLVNKALKTIGAVENREPIKTPRPKRAIILHSLKHPDEVHLLRAIYGPGFWLIGVYASEDTQIRYLTEYHNMTEDEAKRLIKRDYLEPEDKFGQQTSKTFHRADVFIREDNLEELHRFFNLLFGDPFVTPTQDEQAMFIAHAAAMRSASLSRQVGASVLNESRDLVAVGVNEVPSFGGGLFWPVPDKKDLRDHEKPKDPNIEHQERLIREVAERLQKEEGEVKELLKDSELRNLTEFQRAVHAEMEALLACARSGVSPRGGTLYTTVFPCHICAKHIVAAGIKRVVYIEPYPKSRVLDLLNDFIVLDADSEEKVRFEAFVGIGPRRYVDMFSMVMGTSRPIFTKMDGEGRPLKWSPSTTLVRLPMLPTSYLEREAEATKKVEEIMDQM